ncbi:MAG TPA: DUF362 domain-containing protein [Candidatus Omnitrophota bacterium]|nr:DUF362 domain-containing protein [Candidatus Omnitrophota bacterium]
MRPKVFFVRAKKDEGLESIGEKTSWLLKSAGLKDIINKGSLVALKLTFGEKGNTGHIDARHAKFVADEVGGLGGKPFFTDSNTLYLGQRTNAVDHMNLAYEHGFTPDACGAPIMIADGLRSGGDFEVKVDGNHFKSVKISRGCSDADAAVVMSHVTGHMVTGLASAVKNIGMGFATRAGKLMQHSGVKPSVIGDKCIACGLCIKHCPAGAITLRNKTAFIDERKCIGCADCLVACRSDAINISWGESSGNVQEKMAEFALGVMNDKKGRILFLNYAFKITKDCDCLAKDEPAVAPDAGIFASTDPVAIDKASADIINAAAKADAFGREWPRIEWARQLEYGAKIGLGSLDYELVEKP